MILLSGCAYVTLDEHLERLDEIGEEWVDSGDVVAYDDTGDGEHVDTGETGDTGDTEPIWEIERITYEFSDGDVKWWVETGARPLQVQLALIETGDPEFSYDCDEFPKDYVDDSGYEVCGVWTELHSSFPLESEDGTDKGQRLDIVEHFTEQDADQSTLLDSEVVDGDVTWFARVKFDGDADWDTCLADGHYPAYFDPWCN